MALAIAIAVVALLLVGFLLLTAFEVGRRTRIAQGARDALDVAADRAAASLSSGRILVTVGHHISGVARYATHEVVHIVLAAIRALERTLTRAARVIRESNASHASKSRKGKKESPSETTGAEVE